MQLCKSDGKQTVSASIRPMVREPAYCTATGKVLLSGLPSDELEKYFDGVEIKAFTPHTVTSRAALTKEMKRVAADGYALDNEEFVPNLCCLSVPVRSENNGAYIAAVSVAIPKMRFDPKTVPALAVQLQQKAKLIAQQLRMIEG